MAIKINNKIIKDNIEDMDGNVIGEIRYNPEDINSYNALLDIVEKITNVNKKRKKLGNLDKITDITINDENIEEVSESFNELHDFTKFVANTIDEIKESLDSIFGDGTCDLFLQGSKDIELLMPLLNGVLPSFKKAREQKTNKYLKGVQSVME